MTITLAAVLIVGSIARPDQVALNYHDALAAAHRCRTETAWAEQRAEGWVAVCGDAEGSPVVEPASCQELADLHYSVAEAAGLDSDAAYEDTFAGCLPKADPSDHAPPPSLRKRGSEAYRYVVGF
jgi:hypothetical protein